MKSISLCAVGALAAFLSTGSSSAMAALMTQTVNFPAQTTLSSPTTFAVVPISASFAKFNTAFGTLTDVSFVASYDFIQVATIGPSGGNVSSGVNGPFLANGVTVGGSGNGGNAQGSPGTTANSPYTVAGTGTVPAASIGDFASASGGTNTFTFQASIDITLTEPATQSARIDLANTSAVTVTYTYTPVPEPTGICVLGLTGGLALTRRKRC